MLNLASRVKTGPAHDPKLAGNIKPDQLKSIASYMAFKTLKPL